MLDTGIIEESDTPCYSSVLLVTKKNWHQTLCRELPRLERRDILDPVAPPTMEEVLDSISEQRPVFWSALDFRSGCWQTELDSETANRTGF